MALVRSLLEVQPALGAASTRERDDKLDQGMTARWLGPGHAVAIDEAIVDQGVLGLSSSGSIAVGVPDGVEAAVQLRRADLAVTARRRCQDLREAGRRARNGSSRGWE